MNPRTRNTIAEAVSLLGVIYGLLPAWSAAHYAPPAWVGLVLSGLVTIGNQFLKDSEKAPAPPVK